MRHLHPAKAAISVGIVLGLWHLMWVMMVALGIAKPILDYILRLHFLQFDYALAPFAVSTAATLVALTFAIGALIGLVFALVCNWLSKQPETGQHSSSKPVTS